MEVTFEPGSAGLHFRINATALRLAVLGDGTALGGPEGEGLASLLGRRLDEAMLVLRHLAAD